MANRNHERNTAAIKSSLRNLLSLMGDIERQGDGLVGSESTEEFELEVSNRENFIILSRINDTLEAFGILALPAHRRELGRHLASIRPDLSAIDRIISQVCSSSLFCSFPKIQSATRNVSLEDSHSRGCQF